MKKVSVLIIVLVLAVVGIQAQSNTTVIDKKVNRITITTTKVDESGKPVTETWIAEGDKPETILKEMAINPDIMQKVEASQLNTTENEETIFLFRNAGEHTVIEGKLGELDELTPLPAGEGMQKVIIIRDKGDGEKEYKKISTWTGERTAMGFHHGPEKKSNCAAMGVYVLSDTEEIGCRINALIDQGGAMEAGLKEGDVIRKIEEFEVDDFATLHLALAHFMPGDVVTVRFERDGRMEKAKVNLKAWAELPGHEWRQRSDCGKPATATPEPAAIPTEEDPGQINGLEQLHLADVRVYPNPTEGNFALSFNTAPGELTIAITDVNGKVIYQEVNENSTGYYNREIDLRDVPTGNYILSVKQGDKLFTQQVAKQ
jgi:hypothetical protein